LSSTAREEKKKEERVKVSRIRYPMTP